MGWERLRGVPGGRRVFDRLLGAAIPYTGALGARVVSLSPGSARVQLKDRRGVRSHLGSVHAIALANLGELTGNLALAYSLPDDARFIVKSLAIEYRKKARGTIEASCQCDPPRSSEKQSYGLDVTLTDASGDVVASVRLETLVGPNR
jgi:acyl-coenzyme A thioesterase PaaI-like protein